MQLGGIFGQHLPDDCFVVPHEVALEELQKPNHASLVSAADVVEERHSDILPLPVVVLVRVDFDALVFE